MEQYAGLDVSLEATSVCIVDAMGRVVREAKVPSEPEALAALGLAAFVVAASLTLLDVWRFEARSSGPRTASAQAARCSATTLSNTASGALPATRA